jgi:hypothetical protein
MRGRPRKIPLQETNLSPVVEELADLLSKWCGVPGCFGRNHIEEAIAIKKLFESKGVKIS